MLLKFTRLLTTGLFTKFTLGAFNKNISFRESNYIAIITAAGNFFGPLLGGASIRAVYLKKKHNLEYSKFISTMYGYYLITYTNYAAIALVALVAIYTHFGYINGLKVTGLFLLAVLFAGIVAIVMPTKYAIGLSNMRVLRPLRKHLQMAINGWGEIKVHPGLIRSLAIISFVVFLILVTESFILYNLFSADVFFASVVLYTVMGVFTMLISITPGAIGFREGLYLLIPSVLLLDSTQIIQMATVDRSVSFILLVIMIMLTKTKYFSAESYTVLSKKTNTR